jgi:hypothetical protein
MAGGAAMISMLNTQRMLSSRGGGGGGGEFDWKDFLFALVVIVVLLVVGVWFLLTLMQWLDPYPDPNITLAQVLIGQWHWFIHLLHRIW